MKVQFLKSYILATILVFSAVAHAGEDVQETTLSSETEATLDPKADPNLAFDDSEKDQNATHAKHLKDILEKLAPGRLPAGK